MEKVMGIELKEVKTIERFCDICGKLAKGRRCTICQRDICDDHSYRQLDEWGGDYSYKYCTECWKIGESFRRRKSVLTEIYDKEMEDLDKEWYKKALDNINKKGERCIFPHALNANV